MNWPSTSPICQLSVAFFTTEQVRESDFETADSNGFSDDIAKVRQSLAINPALAEVLARQLADSSLPLPVRKDRLLYRLQPETAVETFGSRFG